MESVYNAHGVALRTNYREVNQLTSTVEISHTEVDITRQDTVIRSKDRRWNSGFDTSTKVKYDGWGRVTLRTDAGATTVAYTYDLLSRTTDTLEEAGTDDIYTRMVYDAQSRVTTRAIKRNPADSTWQETTYAFDERSRLITHRRPDAGTTGDIWTYRYDANGNRIGWTDPLGTTVTDTYDARNLIAYRNIARGTGVKGATYESYEFDGLGRLQSCSNYEGSNLITASAWHYNTLSMPQQHNQTVADASGAILGTWTTGAEYDGSGFNTATIYSDGHRVEHTPDALNRVLESYDVTKGVSIGVYQYAGPSRLVERTAGNGVRTSYQWEASGCGCGGSTSFCERVQHALASTGEVLAAEDRRYDVRGLVTGDRRADYGALGTVYRYDEAERLTATYYGVDLFDNSGPDNFAGFADQANTPTVFGQKRAYNLDPRGNRAGSSGIRDSDDSGPTTIWDTAFTADADTNQYTTAGSGTNAYDAMEQLTQDGNTALYHAYDYKGALIADDNDSDLASPERTYAYDNQGKRHRMTDAYNPTVYNTVYLCLCACGGNCSCAAQNPIGDIITLSGATGQPLAVEFNMTGPDVSSPGSSGVMHPGAAAFPGSGLGAGNAIVAQWVYDYANASEGWRFLGHNAHGSLICVTDLNGYRTDMYVYTDYGASARHKVVFDGNDSRISSLSHSTPSLGFTTITLSGTTGLANDDLNGLELVISRPASTGDRYITARVVDTTSSTIVVADAGGALAPVYVALNGQTQGFVVYDFHTGDNTTGGTWTEGPGYNSMLGLTRFTDSTASFAAFMLGWTVILDVEKPSFLTIFGVPPGGLSVEVRGDATGLGASGATYRVIAPPGRGPHHRRAQQTRQRALKTRRQPRLHVAVVRLSIRATPGRPRS